MTMLFLMFAAVIAVCWGVFGSPHIAAVAILMWGTGDAAAALVGIPFGKHKVRLRLTDGKKTWEGSAAMFVVSLATGLFVLLAVHTPPVRAVVGALLGALFGTVAELFSPSEHDTITVPVAIMVALLLTTLA